MITPTPKVSVIIPTYNRQHFLGKAIESVLSQTDRDYEFIIVDDGSTDGTIEWMEATYPNIRLVPLKINRGATFALNEGVRLATGKFIAFLDSDDQWKPGYLAAQVKALEANPNAVSSYCNYLEIKRDGSQKFHDLKPWRIYPNLTHQLLMDNVIHSMSLIACRRDALLKAGGFNETLKITYDRELHLRMLHLGEIVHVPEALVIKVIHEGNLVGNYRRWGKEVMMVLDIFFADDRSQPYRHLEAEARSHWSLKLAKLVWQQNRDIIFTLKMGGQAVWFAPNLISKRVWRQFSKVISNI